MLVLYIAAATVGIVMIVPTVLQAIDGLPGDPRFGFAAFSTLGFGLTGLLASRFPGGLATNLVASLAIGLAAGAVHPEILRPLGEHEELTPEQD